MNIYMTTNWTTYLSDSGVEPGSPALQVDSLPTELSGEQTNWKTRRKRQISRNQSLPRLNQEQRASLNRPVNSQEFGSVIKQKFKVTGNK